MKNTTHKKVNTNIYTVFMASLVVILSLSYIICIYKTVVLASDSEANTQKMAVLSGEINQKEFDYIGQVSSIDIDQALALGYKKNTEDKVAYFNVRDTSELALR